MSILSVFKPTLADKKRRAEEKAQRAEQARDAGIERFWTALSLTERKQLEAEAFEHPRRFSRPSGSIRDTCAKELRGRVAVAPPPSPK
jgi:hypothetical protein